jgi:hypothetical protein
MTKMFPPAGVPQAAVLFTACNQAPAVTAATPVVVAAAPVVATQSYYICKAKYVNPTTAEMACATVINTVTAAILFAIQAENLNVAADAGKLSSGEIVFDPPLRVAAGNGISVNPVTTLGDSYLSIQGWLG